MINNTTISAAIMRIIPGGIMSAMPIETAIACLTAHGRWPRRPADWAVEDAACDATLLRVFAGKPMSDLEAYLAVE